MLNGGAETRPRCSAIRRRKEEEMEEGRSELSEEEWINEEMKR